VIEDSSFTNWRKSHRSDGGDNCVEIAFAGDGTVGVRDSKDPTGPVLRFASAAWKAFTGGARDGEFDINVQ
jgi:hypothetical protein